VTKQQFVSELKSISAMACEQCEFKGNCGFPQNCWIQRLISIVREMINHGY